MRVISKTNFQFYGRFEIMIKVHETYNCKTMLQVQPYLYLCVKRNDV